MKDLVPPHHRTVIIDHAPPTPPPAARPLSNAFVVFVLCFISALGALAIIVFADNVWYRIGGFLGFVIMALWMLALLFGAWLNQRRQYGP